MNYLIKYIIYYLFCSTLIVYTNSQIIINPEQDEIANTLMKSFLDEDESIKIAIKMKYILMENAIIDKIYENIYLKKMLEIHILIEDIQKPEYLELELKKSDQLIKHESKKLINKISQAEVLALSFFEGLRNLEEEMEFLKTNLIKCLKSYSDIAKSLVQNIKTQNILIKNKKLYSKKQKIISGKYKLMKKALLDLTHFINSKKKTLNQ